MLILILILILILKIDIIRRFRYLHIFFKQSENESMEAQLENNTY